MVRGVSVWRPAIAPRLRKIIGAVAIVAFMVGYIWAAIAIGERLPDRRAVQLIFFIVAGTAWGLPLFPLVAWAQRAPDKP